ncbi:60S ribosomal protein L10 [Camelus dromedarius]|uniref:60S ribosomal protein L10 n=1 Tax=Camelus dromedarius TaxID=9838 RepID=A0A5N4BZR8_CAMDR|nr:60S ribosomal protein L10 [Camelus dromedarius]
MNILVSPWAATPPGVTSAVRKSHTTAMLLLRCPDAKIRIFDLGWKKAKVDEFPLWVHIGQVIMSIGTKLQNKEHVIEAVHRAKFKFPGHQKIHISKK